MDDGKPENVARSTKTSDKGETAKTQATPPKPDAGAGTENAVSVGPPVKTTTTATVTKYDPTAKDENTNRALEDTTTVFTLYLSHSGGDLGDTDTIRSVISFHGGSSNVQEREVNDAQDFRAIFGGEGLLLHTFGRNTFVDAAPASVEVSIPATFSSHPVMILKFDFNWTNLNIAWSQKFTEWTWEWHNTGDTNWRATVRWTVFDPRL